MHISFRRLHESVPVPMYHTPGACAFDIAVLEAGSLAPGERKLFRTGLVLRVPDNHVLLLTPRSSNAKKGILLANGVGVIDRDYCGPEDEIRLFLYNIGTETYHVTEGERLAQGLFLPVAQATFVEPSSWETQENRGGFGTTG